MRVLRGEYAQETWSLVTNDPTLTGWEYAHRMWIEEAFRDLKSYGWQLEDAYHTCPQRMGRLWIILVVAYAWMLWWGAHVLRSGQGHALKRCPDGSYVKRLSLFQEGRAAFFAALHVF